MQWFDAHLDLAYLAVCGRDMAAQPEKAGGPDLPGCVTLPSLAAGNVRACLGTIFTEMNGDNAGSYPRGDVAKAHWAGLKQIAAYHAWADRGLALLGLASTGPLRIGVLMECADPITTPDELAWWVEQGVIAVGMAWALGSRYAGGNKEGAGLTDLGRDLILGMDRLKVVHDIAHLSDAALAEVLELARGRIMASHSNCRALIDKPGSPPTQRHLTDATIREVVRRGGVIGLNLYSPFLVPGGKRDRRATIAEAINHVEHVCALAGHRRAVGLGSDMDGGFSAEKLPEGINGPADMVKLCEELRRRAWSDEDIQGFTWGNWARFWGID